MRHDENAGSEATLTQKSQLDILSAQRTAMVKTQLRDRGIRDESVLNAMERVPREEFVADQYRSQAYKDHPLPIGEGQTISQPYIVAAMLEALSLRRADKVLEIGTGTGYQTALLAEIADKVYSMERHSSLAGTAQTILGSLGYSNVTVVVGDGSAGLPQFAPFDAIIVAAAAPNVPQPLFAQLIEGGRMVVPVGAVASQELQLVTKRDGKPIVTSMEGCRFVPLIGAHGYSVFP